MRPAESVRRLVVRELLLALLVLALAFLNFGAASMAFAGGTATVAGVAAPICGDPLSGGDDGSHMACHACRPNVPLLPPVPAVPTAVCFRAQAVAYADLVRAMAATGRTLAALPRGPPAA
jgi:hypothetical protein